jgi:hypothetical protein
VNAELDVEFEFEFEFEFEKPVSGVTVVAIVGDEKATFVP